MSYSLIVINKKIISIGIILTLQACSESTEPIVVEPLLPFTRIAPADDSELSESIKVLFSEDAARMTLKAAIEDSGEALYDVNLPQDYMDNIYNGLIHIYNSRDPLDSVTTNFQQLTHVNTGVGVHGLHLEVDFSVLGIESWPSGHIRTGNSDIDTLITEYNLERTGSDSSQRINLESKFPLNTYALGKKFKIIDGVISVSIGASSSSKNITAIDTGLNWEFDYYYSWGPCSLMPVRCKYEHNWLVQVNQAGDVSLLDSYGDDIHENSTNESVSNVIVPIKKMALPK